MVPGEAGRLAFHPLLVSTDVWQADLRQFDLGAASCQYQTGTVFSNLSKFQNPRARRALWLLIQTFQIMEEEMGPGTRAGMPRLPQP